MHFHKIKTGLDGVAGGVGVVGHQRGQLRGFKCAGQGGGYIGRGAIGLDDKALALGLNRRRRDRIRATGL